MRAAVFCGPRCIQVAERPDPAVAAPTDAIVRVVLGCVCGSDLWYYRGESPHTLGPIGHEFVGVPHGVEVPIGTRFSRNVGLRGGSAPVRIYIPELLDDVLAGRIHPERVFDFETDLDGIA